MCLSKKDEAAPDLMSSSRDTVPAPWLPCPHPEGSLYFIHKGAPSIVSDADLGVDGSQELINYWTGIACDKAKGLGIPLSDSTELYLRMDAGKCNYYFADHEYQIIFWLDPVAVDDLNLEACASSPSHLRKYCALCFLIPLLSSHLAESGLRELYWLHVEQFPAHPATKLSLGMDKLMEHYIYAKAG